MKKLTKDIEKFTKGNITLGIGSAITAKIGYGSSGMAAAGGMMPMVGTTMMGGGVIRMTRSFQGKRKGRRYKTAVGKDFAIGFIDKKKNWRK